MALSQIQCLDNNNVNWRSSETKPEFFYSEEQRLALEALVSTGQDAFSEVVKKENIRDFLSEVELAKIVSRVEAFDPDSSHPRKNGDKSDQEGEGDPQEGVEHSLEYWPDKSDCPIPELDLGWPDTVAYRGVTRATVYMQPPIDSQPHIKEVVRKMITQAQRVIAVVMDLFTDVDIFKDLLESGFKRKVSVYIILNESEVKHFLQMCEKAQMHRGHLKNLRIRSIGGTEFYTRFSTKFKGSLGQKFMFVDGDKTMCGSYSFTWSAARIDRNLITVLSGQVVETFDRQFQELYLLSKGISLKNIPMDNEPEPEPVLQPAAMPTGPTESIAKKLINPKYALVNVKSASETGKDFKKEPEIAKKLPTKQRVSAFEQQDEQQIHPALQDMEKADMFEYLPTWVEPDPEPGSDILGYINIIDPNIKNAQPSQMNRIKICDTSQATAQYLQQTRENEMMKQQQLESPSSSIKHSGQPSQTPEAVPNKSAPYKESGKVQETSQENGSSEGRIEKALQQDSQDGPLSNTRPKEASEVEDCTSKQLNGEESANSEVQELPSPKIPLQGIASLAANNHLVSRNTSSGPTGGNPPPVPKPRTVQVTDFITMKNALNTKSTTSTEENTVPSVNGVDAEGRETEEIDILIENGPNDNDQDEEDSSIFRQCPGEYSSSGSGSLPPSNASSMSEEYYPSPAIHRRSSDRISNGERPPPRRKLSDGHISRGSFLSPLNISQTLLDVNPTENGKRRSMLEDYVLSTNPLQRKERIYALDQSQAKPHFHYTTNGPTGGFDRFHSHPGTRGVGKSRVKKESLEGPGAYRQLSRKSDNPRAGYWSGKDYGSSYTSPLSHSPVPPDNVTTPFGIPYSKLSQAKHLKSKLGPSSLDSRRRGHGPPGHKDL